MNSIRITVYITSDNYGKYLEEAINSVLTQNIDNWELLLFNDNSTDNTSSILEKYEGDERIRVFKTNGVGLQSVANLAIKYAKGDYIIRLDADDIFDENILLILSHHLEADSNIALVFPDYYLIDDHNGLLRFEKRNSIFNSNHSLDTPANGACTMIRKDVLIAVGGYREDLKAQDGFDIWTKIINNYKCKNINLPLFYYRRHGNNLTENTQRILTARRTIKQDAVDSKLTENKPIISIIPCRKNYDIFPDLWSKMINGKLTLLDIAIQTNLASNIFDKIVVTSDNENVKNEITKYKDSRLVFIRRDTKLTIPSSNMVKTIENVLMSLNIKNEGISVLSYIQAPFTTTGGLEEAIFTLILNDSDSSFAVEEINTKLYKRTSMGLAPLNNLGSFRSDFDIIYSDANTSLATKNKNIKTGTLFGGKIVNFIAPKEEVFFIHTKKDFEVAKKMLELI